MKGQIKVKKLNDTGLYISEMDWDNTYICKENPIGNFVMVIEPLSGFDGGIIYFDKKTDGYLIEGEGYILVGRPDSTLPHNKWKYTVKTIEVSKNEPNHILQEFIKITRLPQYTYVTHIKCGRYDYQWYDSCNGAFGVGIF